MSGSGRRGPGLERSHSRRAFFGLAAGGAASLAGTACGGRATGDFFQQHYQELSDEQKRRIFARLEADAKRQTGVSVHIADPPPVAGAAFAFAISLTRCNGNRRCVQACARESNCSRDPEIQYIRVLEMERGSFDLSRADPYYDRQSVPAPGKFYLPVQCQQCRNPPCVKACPTEATWVEPDGLVVIDYNWCIGCRYCQAACPYAARHFNFAPPSVPPDELTPEQAYLSNRLRPVGVVEKCTWCLHRVRTGRYPACVQACPTGARKFGNLGDPTSEVRQVLEHKPVYVLKEELGTLPRFFYFFD